MLNITNVPIIINSLLCCEIFCNYIFIFTAMLLHCFALIKFWIVLALCYARTDMLYTVALQPPYNRQFYATALLCEIKHHGHGNVFLLLQYWYSKARDKHDVRMRWNFVLFVISMLINQLFRIILTVLIIMMHSMTILSNFILRITNAQKKNDQKYDVRLWMAVEIS